VIQPPAEHLIREAAQEWYAKKLPTMTAMLIIYGLLYPEYPNEKDLEWAKRALASRNAAEETSEEK
jgi:hypothetical protein